MPKAVELSPGPHTVSCEHGEFTRYQYRIGPTGGQQLLGALAIFGLDAMRVAAGMGPSHLSVPGAETFENSIPIEYKLDFEAEGGHIYRLRGMSAGEEGRTWIETVPREIVSQDGKTKTYIDINEENGYYKITVDEGTISKRFDRVFYLNISPDRSRSSFTVFSDDEWFVVIDGKESPPYDGIAQGFPIFSPDGGRTAYAALKDNKWLVVIDGKESPPYDGIAQGFPIFSPDGERTAYTAWRNNQWFVVIDGKESPSCDGIGQGFPIFSPDGNKVAYGAIKDNQWFVMVDENEWGPYTLPLYDSFVFSPNSERIAYSAIIGDKWSVVVDGDTSTAYDEILIGTPVFSPGSERMAFAARADDQWFVVVDGKESKRYDAIDYHYDGSKFQALRFSANGKKLLYDAKINGKVQSCEEILEE